MMIVLPKAAGALLIPPLLLFIFICGGGISICNSCSCAAAAAPSLDTAAQAKGGSFFSTTDDSDKQPFIKFLKDNASSYEHTTFLPTTVNPNKGMAAFWKVDGDEFHIAFAAMATGWAVFGIAEAGGMFGADVVSFVASKPTEVVDGYILDDRQVLVDNSQDWTLTSSTVEDGWIIVEATRKLNTGDTQDRVIKNDRELWVASTRIIAAWGDTESVSYHGENRARTSVRIFADPSSSSSEFDAFLGVLAKNADGYFDVLADAYEIPAQETKFKYLCKSYDELTEQFGNETDVTMIGATPIVTEETREFVHHFIVLLIPSCENLLGEDTGTLFKKEQIYGWSPGERGMVLPDDVGFPLFDSETNQAVLIETHYNNPQLISGMRDSSGVRFHYTTKPRLHDAAFLQLGDPLLGLRGVKINDGLTQHEFTCPEACSSLYLDEPVTVLIEKLHMHQTGKRAVNEVIRGGEVVHTASVDFFDFDQQGGFHVHQEPYQLQAGDKFRMTCYYKDGKVFEGGSQEEMCVGFLMYYPAKKVAGYPFFCPYPGRIPCAEEYISTDLSGYEGLGRTFGTPQTQTNETLSLSLSQLPQQVTNSSDEMMHTPTSTPATTSQAHSTENHEQVTAASSSNYYPLHCLFALALSSAAMFISGK
ncbi:hypothetical protein ACHAXM_003380 [Skeletonema potamos]